VFLIRPNLPETEFSTCQNGISRNVQKRGATREVNPIFENLFRGISIPVYFRLEFSGMVRTSEIQYALDFRKTSQKLSGPFATGWD